jgi:hypothetical protein
MDGSRGLSHYNSYLWIFSLKKIEIISTPLSVCGLWSRTPIRRLPSERDTVGGMQIFAYLRPYLFWIVHVFWTAHEYVDGLVSMLCSGSRQCFGIIPCCSPDTHSRLHKEFIRVSWHQPRGPTPWQTDTLLSQGPGAQRPDFISWFKMKVLSNLPRT